MINSMIDDDVVLKQDKAWRADKLLYALYRAQIASTDETSKLVRPLRSSDFYTRIVDAVTRYAFQEHASDKPLSIALETWNAEHPQNPLALVSASKFLQWYESAHPVPVVRVKFYRDAVQGASMMETLMRQVGEQFYGWHNDPPGINRVVDYRNLPLSQGEEVNIVNFEPREYCLNMQLLEKKLHHHPNKQRTGLIHYFDLMEDENFWWFCKEGDVGCNEQYGSDRSKGGRPASKDKRMILYVDNDVLPKLMPFTHVDDILAAVYGPDASLVDRENSLMAAESPFLVKYAAVP